MIDLNFATAQKMQGAVFFQVETTSPVASNFDDPAAEYTAATNQAAVFELADRTQIELRGEDRAKFLHNFCTNDILKLAPGQGCEAFACNVKGRILAHLFVFAGTDSMSIETVAGAEESLLAHLDRYLITEDVQLAGRSAELGELLVSGPRATEMTSAALALDAAELTVLPRYGHVTKSWNNTELSLRRVDWLGPSGVLVSVDRAKLAELWSALVEAGIAPAGSETFHPLRIENRMPLYGVDLTDDNLAQEAARTELAISFKKGCYLGQEPIARIDALGHVNRELRGLRIESDTIPIHGAVVLSAEGQEIGNITSAAVSPVSKQAVALAFLKRGFLNAGTSVVVQSESKPLPAVVV